MNDVLKSEPKGSQWQVYSLVYSLVDSGSVQNFNTTIAKLAFYESFKTYIEIRGHNNALTI